MNSSQDKALWRLVYYQQPKLQILLDRQRTIIVAKVVTVSYTGMTMVNVKDSEEEIKAQGVLNSTRWRTLPCDSKSAICREKCLHFNSSDDDDLDSPCLEVVPHFAFFCQPPESLVKEYYYCRLHNLFLLHCTFPRHVDVTVSPLETVFQSSLMDTHLLTEILKFL